MEPPSKRLKISRIQAQPIYSHDQPRQRRHDIGRSKLTHTSSVSIRPNMDFSKRSPRKLKHGAETIGSKRNSRERRQLAVDVDTVVVGVDVKVDELGNVIDIVTAPPVPLPSVPAVPQFPSDFTVPAVPSLLPVEPVTLPVVPPYPFVTADDQASVSPPAPTDNSTRTNDVTGAAATSIFASSTTESNASPTSSSAASSVRTDSSALAVSTTTGSVTSGASSFLSSITLSDITIGSSLTASDASASTDSTGFVGVGTGAPNVPPGAVTGVSDSTANENESKSDSQTTPAVVGGVVGGIAGIAILLGLLLIILRWVKLRRRGGALQLDEGDTMETGPLTMSERNSFMPPAAAAFLNRFSGASKETDITSSTQERGFQRISGRKLPSAFSPGMSIEEARDIQNLSQSSFYRDSQGFYGGSGGVAGRPTAGATVVGLSALEKETLMPSPARTPVVQHSAYGFVPTGGPGGHTSGASTLSPPHSPLPQVRGTLGRSHPSFDGSRGSKFTEDV